LARLTACNSGEMNFHSFLIDHKMLSLFVPVIGYYWTLHLATTDPSLLTAQATETRTISPQVSSSKEVTAKSTAIKPPRRDSIKMLSFKPLWKPVRSKEQPPWSWGMLQLTIALFLWQASTLSLKNSL
jgi:hypothetical protein